jgi:hypothetical protein
MFQIGFETGKAFRVSAFGEGRDQLSNDGIEFGLRLAVSQLTPGNLLLVAVSLERCGASFRLLTSHPLTGRLLPASRCLLPG